MYKFKISDCLLVSVVILCIAGLHQTDAAQCDPAKLSECVSNLLLQYGPSFTNFKLGFNQIELDSLCSDISNASQCLGSIECSDAQAGAVWIAAKKAAAFLCFDQKQVYLSFEKCYESKQVSQSFQQCSQVTRDLQAREDASQACRIARSYVNCLTTVSGRSCGVNATQFMTPFFIQLASTPAVLPANCSYDTNTVQGPCSTSAIQFCANSFRVYFNSVNASDIVVFNSASDFNNTCKYVDWMTGCLATYGCSDSDAQVQNSWTRYREPLVHLCNDQRQVADATFRGPAATCGRDQCYTNMFGSNSSVRSNCPEGFTLYTSQRTCPVISMSTILETSKLTRVLAAVSAFVLTVAVTGYK